MTTTCLPLSGATSVERCGGKAANLAKLIAAGAPVPDGVVIPCDAADDIDLAPLVAWLAEGELIVRSSAVGEDSEDASFAGQLESVGDVRTAAELRAAIARVRASQHAERVVAYQVLRGAPLAGLAIIVQRQIRSALAGVLFTASPSDPRQMLVEYCGGMGEALVSGAVNPGRLTIDRVTHAWQRLAAPDETADAEPLLLNDSAVARLAALALEIERVFGRPQDIEWAMDATGRLWIVQARPITGHGRTRTGTDGGTATDTETRTHVWSNANVNENFPEPISPLLYSIARVGYYHYFRNLGRAFGISERRLQTMEPALRQIIGVHGARMYYNLTNIHGCLRSAPFGDLLAGSFNQFVGAEETAARRVGAAYRLRQAGELLTIALKTTWQYLFLTRRVETFERTVDSYAATTDPGRLSSKSLGELLADFRGFLDIRYHRWTNASLADAAAMVCYGGLQRLLARAFPGRDQQALHNTLLKALPDLVSGKPALRLWELSRLIRADRDLHALFVNASAPVVLDEVRTNPQFDLFRSAFDAYLQEWGFRCSAELMLTSPSFQEEPAPVIDLLKSYAAMDGESPVDLLRRQEEERRRETTSVLAALRRRSLVQWWLTRTVLAWTQCAIQLRERARLKQALLYSRLRRVSLALGERLVETGRLASADDIFMLTAEEAEVIAAGGEMFPDHLKAVAILRRDAHAKVTAVTPPDLIELERGAYWSPCSAGLQACRQGLQACRPDGSPKGLHYSGVAACGGETTSRAAILLDVTESHKLTRGDVLVTKQTDPGWGPIFPLISGLVIERGGMLSHGAIIAREFGIPSVVGVKDATRLIPHGRLVTVDGNRGAVYLAEEPSC